MADVYEQNLEQKSSLTTSDYIRVVGSDNVSYKQLVSDVAKKIIETYAGSSLAGSSQSVKSAIDLLNSKTLFQYPASESSTADFNDFTTAGLYNFSSIQNCANAPSTASGAAAMLLVLYRSISSRVFQIALVYRPGAAEVYIRAMSGASTFLDWVQL